MGELIHDVMIQQETDSVGGSGRPVSTWSSLCQAWMSKESATGHERFAAGQPSAEMSIRWCCRYREDIDPDRMDVQKSRRLLYQGRAYDITASGSEGRQESIWFMTLAHSKIP